MSSRALPRLRTARGVQAIALAVSMSAVLVACSDAGPGDSKASVAKNTSVAGRLAGLAQKAADTGSLGVIVRVEPHSGRPLAIARQASWTKADHHLEATDQFRIASNTKTVTATLILQSVAEHRIQLDDSVEKWLPGLIPNGTNITVRMLLNHTSGLGDYLLTPEFLPTLTGKEKRTWTPEQLLAITPRQTPELPPGKKYSYSNANYAALELILEKATGKSLADLIDEKITEPLEMNDTFLSTDAAFSLGKPHAVGYEPDAQRLSAILPDELNIPEGSGFVGPERPHGNVETAAIDVSWSGAAGGLVSTAADWQRYLTALMSGKILPKTQMKEMLTTVPAPEEGGSYGLGLMKVETPCGTVWGHTGGQPGYSSEIYTDTNGRRSAAVLTTTNFGIQEPKAASANKALVDAAICAMLDKPHPAESDAPSS